MTIKVKRLLAVFFSLTVLLPLNAIPVRADSVTDTITICVGYYGWTADQYVEKASYHWSELDDWYGGALDSHVVTYSAYSGGRGNGGGQMFLVSARGFYVRDLLEYANVDIGSIANVGFFTTDGGSARSWCTLTKYELFDLPRYYFPNLSANDETGEQYPADGDDVWNGAVCVEAMLALEDFSAWLEWEDCGYDFEQAVNDAGAENLWSAGSRFHLLYGQYAPEDGHTYNLAKYCNKILITFSGKPVLSTDESNLELKVGSDRKLELTVDAEDALLNDYVLQNILWTSSNPDVVSVSEDGTITVLAPGEAVITASFGESSVSVSVSVGEEESGGTGMTGGGSTGADTGTAPSETPPETVEDAPPAESQSPVTELETEQTGETELVSGQEILRISSSALAGLQSGSPEAQDTNGGQMDADSQQLILQQTDRTIRARPVYLAAGGAFLAGVLGELLRYRYLMKGKRHEHKHGHL
ncbi:MAG: Ig domain-containing protein [Oscillospiraceae bacterium]